MSEFEVIGYDDDDDDDEVEGDVMGYYGSLDGDVMGFEGSAIVGYDDYGQPIVGRAKKKKRRVVRRRKNISVVKPKFRMSQVAPGVIAPDQGLLPLPLTGRPSNLFDLNTATITFEGQIQKPFRGERLLVSAVRTGTTAVGRLISQLFVGTDLQQLDVPGFDAEQVGDPNAFGVRLTMKPAQPGVFIRLVTTLSSPLTTTDTIFASITLLGRNIH